MNKEQIMNEKIGQMIGVISSELYRMGLKKPIHGIFRVNVEYGFIKKVKSVNVENEIRVEFRGEFPLAKQFVGERGQKAFDSFLEPYFLELYQAIKKGANAEFSFLTVDLLPNKKFYYDFIYDENDIPFDVKAAEWRKSLESTITEKEPIISTLTKDEELINIKALNILNSNLSDKKDKIDAIKSLKLVMMANDDGLIDKQYLITKSETNDHEFLATGALSNELFTTVLKDEGIHPIVANYEDIYHFGQTFNEKESLTFFIIDGNKGILLPLDLIKMAAMAA